MLQPTLSVILPVFNAEKYLNQAIESILNQTFDDFELIIINDGSTDSSKEIINSFNDERIVFVDQKNSGLPRTLNKGILISRAEIIVRMDADDISKLDRFQKQYSYLSKNKDVDVLGGSVNYINNKGKYLGRTFSLTRESLISYYLLNVGNVMCHPTLFVRKSAFERVGVYNTMLTENEDYHLLCKFLRSGIKLINLPDVLLDYRVHDKAISSNNFYNRKNSLAWRKILNKDNPSKKLIAALEVDKLKLKNLSRNYNFDNLENQIFYLFKLIFGRKLSGKMITFFKNIFLLVSVYISGILKSIFVK